MSVRDWRIGRGMLVLGFLLQAAGAHAASANLLFVTIDTIRADRVGCYGYAAAETPNLDRLAREGIHFEKAFSPVPLTLPAHSSLLTGTYPLFHGVRDNSGYVLPPSATTLAEVLQQKDYRTGAVVGAYVLDSKFGLDQGFEEYFDNFDLPRNESVSPGYIQRPANEVADRALEWLGRQGAGPFFLWVHFYDPHDPYLPPEPFSTRHRGRPYDGEIAFTDSNLGRLLQWLDQNRKGEPTVVVVVGDHGESLGEHGEDKHGLLTYNATQHVPLLMRLPGGEAAGRTVEAPVSTIDILPTLVQILGLDRNSFPDAQGRGFYAQILNRGAGRAPEIYSETYYPYRQFGWSPLRSLISGKHKLILAPEVELYDLEADFSERKNLASEQGALANQLTDRLRDLMSRFQGSRTAEAQQGVDPETEARLRSLGYVALSPGRNLDDVDYARLPDPKRNIALYQEITDLFELSASRRYAEVIPRYRRLLEQQPDLRIVRYKLGQALFETRQLEAAAEEFRAVIASGGEESLAVFDLAQTYLRLNRLKDAIVGFEQAVKLDPAHYRARTNLGVIYKNQGRLDEALEQLREAVRLAPTSTFALGNLAVVVALKGREEEAVRMLQQAVEMEPDNALLHANLAQVYRKMGNHEAAQREMEIARRLNPALGRPR